jgi:hypothetical protein
MKHPLRHPLTWAVLASLWTVAPVHAAEPAADPLAPRTEAEAAVQAVAPPIEQRRTVRNDAGRYDVRLVSKLDFEKLSDLLRKAVGARRELGHGWRLEHWTYLETDRSYVGDLTGQETWRLRLTRHLTGSLIELENLGDQADAPPWAPPYRPRPVLLPHGSVR